MRYEHYRSDNSDPDQHLFYLPQSRFVSVYFYPINLWQTSFRFSFHGWDCPILKISTPWIEVFGDFRGKITNVVRNTEV